MGGARTAGGGNRDRTRHFPLVKNPHKMEEVLFERHFDKNGNADAGRHALQIDILRLP